MRAVCVRFACFWSGVQLHVVFCLVVGLVTCKVEFAVGGRY